MAADGTIDYESLHQEALRGLVRSVLTEVVKSGLPGDHHFYISYDVRSPGVALSKRLREKYPTEMTIVLQHRFWDLSVGDDRFEVKLTFDGIPERLVVPFSAIKVFLDPSVRFVLQFDDAVGPDRDGLGDDANDGANGRTATARKRASRAKPRPERILAAREPIAVAPPDISSGERRNGATPRSKPTAVAPASADGGPNDGVTKLPAPDVAPAASPALSVVPDTDDTPAAPGGGQVVSLDAFRKK